MCVRERESERERERERERKRERLFFARESRDSSETLKQRAVRFPEAFSRSSLMSCGVTRAK